MYINPLNIAIICGFYTIISCTSNYSSSTKEIDNVKIKNEPSLRPELALDEIDNLAQLPLDCVDTEYPNKLSQTIGSETDLKNPKALHPAFYGCFDWHSAVHGHWTMVSILKQYPNIASADRLRRALRDHITADNITQEMAYFEKKINKGWERTYGWAWLLKLAGEIHTWDDPLARELEMNLDPLAKLIAHKYEMFLPKLKYPIRVGTHTNTAFGLTFAFDYALTMNRIELLELIKEKAKDFYLDDKDCPMLWEPSGYDFLSPCLEEMDLMRRVLKKDEFEQWMNAFLPQLKDPNYELAVGEVVDRTDGHLVHLDGVNFSRAWCFYGLARHDESYTHLLNVAHKHMVHSLPNLVNDSYEGGHWLGSFAIYALNCSKEKHFK